MHPFYSRKRRYDSSQGQHRTVYETNASRLTLAQAQANNGSTWGTLDVPFSFSFALVLVIEQVKVLSPYGQHTDDSDKNHPYKYTICLDEDFNTTVSIWHTQTCIDTLQDDKQCTYGVAYIVDQLQ